MKNAAIDKSVQCSIKLADAKELIYYHSLILKLQDIISKCPTPIPIYSNVYSYTHTFPKVIKFIFTLLSLLNTFITKDISCNF